MIALQCKTCGASLEFDPTEPCITCQYCGAEYLREDKFVQDVIANHIRLSKTRASLNTAIKTNNFAMQYNCLSILYDNNQQLDDYQLVLLAFYNILRGADVTSSFLDSLSIGYCTRLLTILDDIPDSYTLGNKPISKLAAEFFLKAYQDNNYSNPFRDNASMAKTKTHKRKNPKLALILSCLSAIFPAWVLLLQGLELSIILPISIGIGLFVYLAFAISRVTTSIMHTPCLSPGLPRGSMLYLYQDGIVIVRNNKPDIFLFQGIQRVFLQSSGVITFLLGNQMTSVTLSLPNLDAGDLQRLITYATTKIKALEANFNDTQ